MSLTINQEKKIRADRRTGNTEYFDPEMVSNLCKLAMIVRGYRLLKNEPRAADKRKDMLAEIDELISKMAFL